METGYPYIGQIYKMEDGAVINWGFTATKAANVPEFDNG